MSEEDFLKRWSRRKREVAEAEKAEPPAAPAEEGTAPEAGKPACGAELQPVFDPASLPPIESITELSDVTAFLRAGVPADLTRAALRHVWTADPSIRNFVGLAENAWDFTDPNAMPGFGPLENTEAVRRMIAQVVDEIGRSAGPIGGDAREEPAVAADESNKSDGMLENPGAERPSQQLAMTGQAETDQAEQNDAEDLSEQVIPQSNKNNTAMQHDFPEAPETAKQTPRRRHGHALPQ